MCGIYGSFDLSGKESISSLRDAMGLAIAHRGPDQNGCHVEPGFFMGINRLAIVDLLHGDQPMANEDGRLKIVYNGEIYNHDDIRRILLSRGHVFKSECDTETVLHAFEEYGPECIKKFNGMFAFAIWNTVSKKLFLARDRLGVKPLYLACFTDGMAFASEAKSLLHIMRCPTKPNWTSIYRYFSFGYVPSPESPFEGITKLPPGHYAWSDGKCIETVRYWQPSYGSDNAAVSKDEVSKKVLNLMERAVEMELMSDVPIGVFLSGGLDSSAVALLAKAGSRRDIHSFALKFEESTHDESYDARLVANHLGLEHHEFPFSSECLVDSLFEVANSLDEPFADSTVLPLLSLSHFTREHVKVVLTGWGGDEIFAGYPTYRAHKLSRIYRKLPRLFSTSAIPALTRLLPVSDRYMSLEFKAKKFVAGVEMSPEMQHLLWMGYFDDEAKGRLFRKNILDDVMGETYGAVKKLLGSFAENDLISRMMHLDVLYFLEGNGLFQADRMTMAASVEARVPLLNVDLLEYTNSLPSEIKMPRGSTKFLLKRILKGRLPERILRKPKKGFGPPLAAWTRGPLSGIIRNVFSTDRVNERGIFEPDFVGRLMSEHFGRKADHGRCLWSLLGFQLWYDKFIMGKSLNEYSAFN